MLIKSPFHDHEGFGQNEQKYSLMTTSLSRNLKGVITELTLWFPKSSAQSVYTKMQEIIVNFMVRNCHLSMEYSERIGSHFQVINCTLMSNVH